MFLGRYAHNLDAKGRLAIPARYREALAEGVILTRGIDRCLALYPLEAWRPLAEKVAALPITDADARNFRRLVFAEAADLTLDAQGRILIPPDLRRYAEFEREALIVGVDASIEIWSPQRWAAVESSLDTDGAEIAQRLASFSESPRASPMPRTITCEFGPELPDMRYDEVASEERLHVVESCKGRMRRAVAVTPLRGPGRRMAPRFRPAA